MAKKVYIGESNLAKKIDEIYLGINGKARKVTKAYIGINGAARQFWPELILYYWNKYNSNALNTYYWNRYNRVTTYRYYWDRYNVNSTSTYYWNQYSVIQQITYKWDRYTVGSGTVPSPRKINQSTTLSIKNLSDSDGKLFYTEDAMTGPFRSVTYGSSEPYFVYDFDSSDVDTISKPYGTKLHRLTNNDILHASDRTVAYHVTDIISEASIRISAAIHLYTATGDVAGDYIDTIEADTRDTYPDDGIHTDGYWYIFKEQTSRPAPGMPISTVSSMSENAYPQNGQSGNYWYIFDRVDTEYSQGSYIGETSSSDRSAYPDDGRSGNYWYVYDRQTASYSQGSYINQVSSTNRGAYPDNNYSGSYWYVYDHMNTTYSKGSYIGVVQSENPSAYPNNGRHTDGYWYVKQ